MSNKSFEADAPPPLNSSVRAYMKILRNPAFLFGLASFPVSLPIAWFFWGPGVPSNVMGAHIWPLLPPIAALLSFSTALLLSHAGESFGFGPWRGVLVSFVALIGCAATVSPVLIPAALIVVGWIVLPLGGIAGWLVGRRAIPNNSFKADAPPPLNLSVMRQNT